MANGNPPAPGQTVTNGTWGPPPETPPPPPQPAVGQNQLLRLKLGMGVKAFADGTPNVQPPTPWGLPGIPLGHAPMGAPFTAYSDTTPTTGISIGGPGGISLPPTMLDSARAAAGGPPAQPGQSQWPTSMLQNAQTAQVANRAAPRAAPQAQNPTQVAQAGPGDMGALLAAMTQTPAGKTSLGKDIKEPDAVQAKAQYSGASIDNAAAMHEAGDYTPEEFYNHTKNMTIGMMERMLSVAPHLTTEQQMLPRVLQGLHGDMTSAQAAYQKAIAAGDHAGAALAQEQAGAAYNHLTSLMWRHAEGSANFNYELKK